MEPVKVLLRWRYSREHIIGDVNETGHVGDRLEEGRDIGILGLGVAEDGIGHVHSRHIPVEIRKFVAGTRNCHVLEAVVALQEVASEELEHGDLQHVGHDSVEVVICLAEQDCNCLEQVVWLPLASEEALVELQGLLDHLVALANNVVVLNNEPSE